VRDVHALFKEFEANGAIIAYEPEERKAYGNIEFAIKDPGYIIAFAQEISGDRFFGVCLKKSKARESCAIDHQPINPKLTRKDFSLQLVNFSYPYDTILDEKVVRLIKNIRNSFLLIK
jgi:hypothetical protein